MLIAHDRLYQVSSMVDRAPNARHSGTKDLQQQSIPVRTNWLVWCVSYVLGAEVKVTDVSSTVYMHRIHVYIASPEVFMLCLYSLYLYYSPPEIEIHL